MVPRSVGQANGLAFEDFSVGDVFETDGITLTETMIIGFAFAYDPQPFHLDTEAASRSPYGGLIASGFQTLALTFRLFRDTGAISAFSLGEAGADELRWLRPVRPGDTLRVKVVVAGLLPARRPDRGMLRLSYTTSNQRGEAVMLVTLNHLVMRRTHEGLT
ncbi:MAG: MaoC family dehydratase [Rhodospirillaceae bacterium]